MKDIVLTLMGPDRAGIVARLAAIAGRHEGNWLDSRLMELGGIFSGMLRLEVPEEQLEAFAAALKAEMEPEGFQFTISETMAETGLADAEEGQLHLSGQDHPGIVQALFEVLREEGINVQELSTERPLAAWSGTPLFEAQARFRMAQGTDVDRLHQRLETVAADLLVEIELES